MSRAQKCTCGAEFVGIAETPGRDSGDAIGSNLGDALALLLGGFAQHATQAIGIKSARQDIVDGDIVAGHRTRNAGQKRRQSGPRA